MKYGTDFKVACNTFSPACWHMEIGVAIVNKLPLNKQKTVVKF